MISGDILSLETQSFFNGKGESRGKCNSGALLFIAPRKRLIKDFCRSKINGIIYLPGINEVNFV